MDYETATMDELQAEFVRLGVIHAQTGTERARIDEIMQRRRRDAAVRGRLLAMEPKEKEALFVALRQDTDIAATVTALETAKDVAP